MDVQLRRKAASIGNLQNIQAADPVPTTTAAGFPCFTHTNNLPALTRATLTTVGDTTTREIKSKTNQEVPPLFRMIAANDGQPRITHAVDTGKVFPAS